jgi:hypothetical protein
MSEHASSKTFIYAAASLGTLIIAAGAAWLLIREESLEDSYNNEIEAISKLKYTVQGKKKVLDFH